MLSSGMGIILMFCVLGTFVVTMLLGAMAIGFLVTRAGGGGDRGPRI